jgi:hypothetical protein
MYSLKKMMVSDESYADPQKDLFIQVMMLKVEEICCAHSQSEMHSMKNTTKVEKIFCAYPQSEMDSMKKAMERLS